MRWRSGIAFADATAAPVVLVTVFAHHPLRDSEDPELVSTRTDARETLMELARAEGLEHAEVVDPCLAQHPATSFPGGVCS